MNEPPDPLINRILARRLEKRDEPTETHHTLEVVAYWKDDLLDSVRAGRKRKIVVGGYHANRRADLQVELPHTLRRFTIARIKGRAADVTIPKEAQVALQKEDGAIITDLSLTPCRAPFEAGCVRLEFRQRLCFSVGLLTFLLQFVHRDGKPRHDFDWLLPRQWAGEP